MYKKRAIINIDKMRLSFRQPTDLFNKLAEYQSDTYLNYQDFKLHIIDNDRKEGSSKEPTKIIADVVLADNRVLGEFAFNDSAKYEGLCFFSFRNELLYTSESIVAYLDYVANALGLEYKSITEIELALDINTNPVPLIRKLIKNHMEYDMIYNGKKVTDSNRKIESYCEIYGRSREKLDKMPTLIFGQKKETGLEMKVYNKRREILEESPKKSYIEGWNGFKGKYMYRLEIVVKWEEFKKWLKYINSKDFNYQEEWKRFISSGKGEHIAPSEPHHEYIGRTIDLLEYDHYKAMLWLYCANRMLYFRNKRTDEKIDLADIALGWKAKDAGL